MSLFVEGVHAPSVTFSGAPHSVLSSAFVHGLQGSRTSNWFLVTTVVPPHGPLSFLVDCSVDSFASHDVVLGLDWVGYLRESLQDGLGLRLYRTFNAWLYFHDPLHPLSSSFRIDVGAVPNTGLIDHQPAVGAQLFIPNRRSSSHVVLAPFAPPLIEACNSGIHHPRLPSNGGSGSVGLFLPFMLLDESETIINLAPYNCASVPHTPSSTPTVQHLDAGSFPGASQLPWVEVIGLLEAAHRLAILHLIHVSVQLISRLDIPSLRVMRLNISRVSVAQVMDGFRHSFTHLEEIDVWWDEENSDGGHSLLMALEDVCRLDIWWLSTNVAKQFRTFLAKPAKFTLPQLKLVLCSNVMDNQNATAFFATMQPPKVAPGFRLIIRQHAHSNQLIAWDFKSGSSSSSSYSLRDDEYLFVPSPQNQGTHWDVVRSLGIVLSHKAEFSAWPRSELRSPRIQSHDIVPKQQVVVSNVKLASAIGEAVCKPWGGVGAMLAP
ncbi:hypothetical protein FB451DRAFT_1442359 [Mycena latifolia]|nr:hypothetical protein FB451DRAFT_1442359 [Mycena latifolia]